MEKIIATLLSSPLIFFAWEGVKSKGIRTFDSYLITWCLSLLAAYGYSLLR